MSACNAARDELRWSHEGARRVLPPRHAPAPASNFLRAIVADDNRTGKYGGRVVTRFPPEPNGYLHYGHAKSICLNFGLAAENGGPCHLRFDDTNPLKEDVEYEDSIADAVRWLGFDWGAHRYHASDYYGHSIALPSGSSSRVSPTSTAQSAEEMRATRGTLTQPGRAEPVPRPRRRREPRPVPADERRRVPGRRARAAR